MKKASKLNLNKMTISNLNSNEMNSKMGGWATDLCISKKTCSNSGNATYIIK
jgi:natural product precursor